MPERQFSCGLYVFARILQDSCQVIARLFVREARENVPSNEPIDTGEFGVEIQREVV